jgi:hypothetical protein
MEQQPIPLTEQPGAEPEIIPPGAPVDFRLRGPDIGRYSGTRAHLCGEVGTGRQRGVISGYRLSRRVRALSAPWRCLDLLGSDWRAYDWCNSLGGLAR